MKKTIGFIGQGWIGKNYADDFENRGFEVVRYSLEEPHINNKGKIKECDIVFIAVPTPTTKNGFDASILRKAVKDVGVGKIAVIKSTMIPGTTEDIQSENESIFVMHSPEFLREVTAKEDAAHPERNIIGVPVDSSEYIQKAEEVMGILPKAPFELICKAREAELVKYGGNVHLYIKVVFMNMFYDLSQKHGADWDVVSKSLAADSRIGTSHLMPVHKSGRGAGGGCFIKDFAAFAEEYKRQVGEDSHGLELLEALKHKNNNLLVNSDKDIELLTGVYGEEILANYLRINKLEERVEDLEEEMEKISSKIY